MPDSSKFSCFIFAAIISHGVNFRTSLFSNTRRMTLRAASLTVALLGTGVARAFPPAPYYTLYGVVCHDSNEQTSASMLPAAGPAPIRTMSIPAAGLFSGLSERAPCLLRGKSQRLAPPMHHAAARPVAFSNPLK